MHTRARVLEVAPDVASEGVTRSYRRAMLRWHPDKQPVGATVKERMHAAMMHLKAQAAYDCLRNEAARREYDAKLALEDAALDRDVDDDGPRAAGPAPGPSGFWRNMFTNVGKMWTH